jgi:glutamyl-tRNA reductase
MAWDGTQVALVLSAAATLVGAGSAAVVAYRQSRDRKVQDLTIANRRARNYVERLLDYIYTLRAQLRDHGATSDPIPTEDDDL